MKPTDGDGESTFRTHDFQTLSRSERWTHRVDLFILSPARIIWGDWRTRIGCLIITFFIFVGTVGIFLVEAPYANQGPLHQPPFQTMEHPLGTDGVGQDMLSLHVHATPRMLKMILSGGVFATGVATILGTVAGYRGGRVDNLLTTIMDGVTAVPGLPLAIVITVILQPDSPWVVGVVLTINVWAGLARAIRSQVLTLREENYVEVSRAMHLPLRTIIARDITPNIMPYVLINFVNAGRIVIFSSVALYFLGVLPQTTHWGVIMNRAYQNSGALYSWDRAYTIMLPIAVIVLLSLGLILVAQGADRIFNPRVRARSSSAITDDDRTVEAST